MKTWFEMEGTYKILKMILRSRMNFVGMTSLDAEDAVTI